MDKELELLKSRIDLLEKIVNKEGEIRKYIKQMVDNVDEKVHVVFDGVKNLAEEVEKLYKVAEVVGKRKLEDCVYSRGGYCEEITHAIADPSKVDISTTQKDSKYYPRVTWRDCYLCSKCQVPPTS